MSPLKQKALETLNEVQELCELTTCRFNGKAKSKLVGADNIRHGSFKKVEDKGETGPEHGRVHGRFMVTGEDKGNVSVEDGTVYGGFKVGDKVEVDTEDGTVYGIIKSFTDNGLAVVVIDDSGGAVYTAPINKMRLVESHKFFERNNVVRNRRLFKRRVGVLSEDHEVVVNDITDLKDIDVLRDVARDYDVQNAYYAADKQFVFYIPAIKEREIVAYHILQDLYKLGYKPLFKSVKEDNVKNDGKVISAGRGVFFSKEELSMLGIDNPYVGLKFKTKDGSFEIITPSDSRGFYAIKLDYDIDEKKVESLTAKVLKTLKAVEALCELTNFCPKCMGGGMVDGKVCPVCNGKRIIDDNSNKTGADK